MSKLKVQRNMLLRPITALLGITSGKNAIPILANVMISMGAGHGAMWATDLENTASILLPAVPDATTTLTFLINARKFYEILKELDNDLIELHQEKAILHIKQKQTSYDLALQDPEEYPEMPKITKNEEGEEKTVSVKAKTLRTAIDKVEFAIGRDETRFIMTGLYLVFKGNVILSVATDGFRMSCYGQHNEQKSDLDGFVVTRKSLAELKNIILTDPEGNVSITKTMKNATFKTASASLAVRLIEGSFPDYTTVIPKSTDYDITVDKELLLKGIKKVISVRENNEPVTFTCKETKLHLKLESKLGVAQEHVEIGYSGPEINASFNADFFLDVLSRQTDNSILIGAPIKYGAYLVKGVNSTNYANVIMPIRL